jgi:hypothetical protein
MDERKLWREIINGKYCKELNIFYPNNKSAFPCRYLAGYLQVYA